MSGLMFDQTSEINPVERAYRALLREGRPVVKLFSGNPNEHGIHFPGDILNEEYARYYANQSYRPDPKGDPTARAAIRDYYAAQGSSVSAENVILTSGTSESFFYLFSLLASPGDNILAPNPSYPLFDYIAGLARVELRYYPLRENRGWEVDMMSLAEQIDVRTCAIVLISPNNPTGSVISAEQMGAIVELANRHDLAIISDEVYSEFVYDLPAFPRVHSVAQPKLLFTLNGISKMFALPALKLGWIAVSGEARRVARAVDTLETIADTFLSTHTPIQLALPRLFRDGAAFWAHYQAELRRRRDLAVERLSRSERIRFNPPQGGFHLMAAVHPAREMDEEGFVIALMRATGVFVHPGYFYDYESGIHIALSFLAQPAILAPALDQIVQFLAAA
jgi:aspartate/methionine/tyrosine aminotransferase